MVFHDKHIGLRRPKSDRHGAREFAGEVIAVSLPHCRIARVLIAQGAGQLDNHGFFKLRAGIARQAPGNIGHALHDAHILLHGPSAQFTAVIAAHRQCAPRRRIEINVHFLDNRGIHCMERWGKIGKAQLL